ncbi:glycosyltransferase family 4 protein [Escherichia coli]|nr:glycosyltransferase family 4 protein [Escherichia coli]PAQ78055.1 glycosyl transferase family 1 [Escherichia coli]
MTELDKTIIFDSRWIGDHGIGRFAREIFERIDCLEKIGITGKPSGKLDFLWLTLYLARKKKKFFSPGYNAPVLFLKRSVITVHDLNHVDVEHNTSLLKKIYYRLILKHACKRCHKVLTVSEFSKQRIAEWAGISKDKIVVVGNGVSDAFNNSVPPYEHEKPFIFIAGNRKLHKNEHAALRAFAKSSLRNSHSVIMTGSITEELSSLIKELDINDDIFFCGRVTDKELASIYKGASVLFFPSLYEGFGLPVIEAMSCGTPVITSNTTSLGEVSGDAALLVDPTNINEMTYALESVCSDERLRETLISKGFERCKRYTWENTINIIKREVIEKKL